MIKLYVKYGYVRGVRVIYRSKKPLNLVLVHSITLKSSLSLHERVLYTSHAFRFWLMKGGGRFIDKGR